MPRGHSGRIVLEIDPQKKRLLYATLDEEGCTLKDWFLRHVDQYVECSQFSLFVAERLPETGGEDED